MRNTGAFWFPNNDFYTYGANPGTDSLSVDNSGTALVTYMPYTTTVDKIAFFVAATTLAGDLTARIETVTASTSTPSGSLYHADGTGTRAMLTTDDAVWCEITFTAPVSITGGDLVAFTLNRLNPSTFTGTIRRVIANAGVMPVIAVRTGGAWSLSSSRVPTMAVHSTTDGWIHFPGVPLYVNNTTLNISPSTTPDEVGAKLTMPVTARLSALNLGFSSLTAADAFTLRLYDSSNNVIWSLAQTVGTDITATAGSRIYAIASRPLLKKGQIYRIACEATNGTITIAYAELPSSTYLAASGLRDVYGWTERTDAGSWTDEPTRIPYFTCLLDQVATNVPASPLIG